MLNLDPAWEEAFAGDVEPVYLVRFDLGRRLRLTVNDWTLGAGESFTYDPIATAPFVFTEGGSPNGFTAEVSNAQTARNIAAEFVRRVSPVHNLVRSGAWADDNVVTINCLPGTAHTLVSSNASAWSVSTDGTEQVSFVSGNRPLFGYSASVSNVKPIASEFKDPIRRDYERGKAHIIFADNDEAGALGGFRNLVEAYPSLCGKHVTISIGTPDLDEADFQTFGVFRVRALRAREGATEVICEDAGSMLRDASISNYGFAALHPLEAIEDALEYVGVPPELYDATTLDPTQYADIGHWSVTRSAATEDSAGMQQTAAIRDEGENAQVLVNGLAELMDGMFLPNEAGVYSFRRFDSSASPVATLTAERDISDFRQPKTWDDIFNHIRVTGSARADSRVALFEANDIRSQQKFAAAGAPAYIKSQPINSKWLNAHGIFAAFAASATPPFDVRITYAHLMGFSGCRYNPPTTTQATNTDCSAARPVYLLFYDEDGRSEFMRVEAIAPFTSQGSDLEEIEGRQPPRPFFHTCDFTVAERALFGTTAQDWSPGVIGATVADATIAVDVGSRRLARQSFGSPEVEFTLPFRWFALQVGDTVLLDHDLFIDHGRSGAGQ